jgi:disulfide bond formation protein DsbB
MEASTLNTLFGTFTLILQVLSVVLIVLLVAKKNNVFTRWFSKNALCVAFVVALGGMSGSLIYSEVIGYAPCTLCWYQRILMYPQVFMALVAMTKKFSKEIFYYIRVLSYIGAGFALYHSIIKMTGVAPIPCSAYAVSGADCVKQLVIEFGYINIPMMSFTLFVLLIVLSYYGTKK